MDSQSGWDTMYDDGIDKTYYISSDWEQVVRALMGALLILGIMICSVFCLYKYAVCQKNKEIHNNFSKKPIKIIVKEYDIV